MHVTVAICTWNRAALLDATLASLARLSIPEGVTWSVVVADNNSTDATSEVLDKHAGRLPLARLFVPQQGKSYALNEIVPRLSGDLVLWTDDDALVSENWVSAYVEAAERWPEAAFFGGPVVPRFLAEEPAWLRPAWRTLSGVYGERALGAQPFELDRKRLPFGVNMAARVAVQKRYRYDPQLGRRGALLLSGEETALMQQWLADGYRGMWVPDGWVEHLITPDRLELDHIRRFFFSLAESKRPQGLASWSLVRLLAAGWYACRALKYHAWGVFYPAATQPYRWMKSLTRTCYCWGRVEAQWGRWPQWLKPAPLRRLKQNREQPRAATGAAPPPGPAIAQTPLPISETLSPCRRAA